MKTKLRILTTIALCLFIETTYAQAPQAIPYQAVARDNLGNLIANTTIAVRFMIHNLSAAGSVVYSELHHPTTNTLGLFSLNIGLGTPLSGTFSTIAWSTGAKYLEVGMDPADGASYINMGTQQMMSVPYALYAASAGSGQPIISAFNGSVQVSIAGSSSAFVFVGPTTSITVTSTNKITGSATAVLALSGGSAQNMDYGLCYQLNGVGVINAFAVLNYLTTSVTTNRQPYTATNSVAGLPAGTYTVGLGVKNTGSAAINNNDYVNGWVMISN